MGNKHTGKVSEDVKRQAESDCEIPMYKFVNLRGGGNLIDLMKKAIRDDNYEEVSLSVHYSVGSYDM